MTTTARAVTWLRRFHLAAEGGLRLICLPHAGGSASFFFPLSRALSPQVEVLGVQYPGRQDRYREPNIDNIAELADQITEVLSALAPRALALFGHSMGAVVAYEVVRRMAAFGLPAPIRLFASGRRAPSRYRAEAVHQRSDDGIVAELRRLSGTHAGMLADEEMVRLILPAVRSDYRAIETYRHPPGPVVDCPVTVLAGDTDPMVTQDEANDWARHTTGTVDVHVFHGGHFFLVDRAAEVTDVVAQALLGPAGTGLAAGRRLK